MMRRFSLLDELKLEDLEVLESDRSVLTYTTGEYVYKRGTRPLGLLCLRQGKVKITIDGPGGYEQILALKKPVDFLGFSELMREDQYSSSAVALEETSVCFIAKKDLDRVVHRNPQFSLKIIKYLTYELDKAYERTCDLTQKHMRGRMADALIYVHETYRKAEDDYILNVNLKRSDLAALSNMTTSNAIRTLSDFAKSDLIEVEGRKIKLKDPIGLRKISLMG